MRRTLSQMPADDDMHCGQTPSEVDSTKHFLINVKQACCLLEAIKHFTQLTACLPFPSWG